MKNTLIRNENSSFGHNNTIQRKSCRMKKINTKEEVFILKEIFYIKQKTHVKI